MNIEQMKLAVVLNAEAGVSTLVESGSGYGKSQGLWEAGRKLQKDGEAKGERWGLGQAFAATMTPVDAVGFQFKGSRTFSMPDGTTKEVTVTDASVPLWMISTEGKPAFMYDKFYLIIDEYGQGEADTKRMLAEIFLNGGTPPWYLPEGSVVVAATNAGARYGVTKDFDFAISRRQKITVHKDIAATIAYWDKPYMWKGKKWEVMPVTKAWAKNNPEHVYEDEPEEQGPWGNPRSVCAMDRVVQTITAHNNGKIPLEKDNPLTTMMLEMAAGQVGMPCAQSYMASLEFTTELPQYEAVIADPEGAPLPKRADLLLLMAYQLAAWAQPQHMAECLRYMQRDGMPKDMGITFVTSLLKRNYKAMINLPPMQAYISKNATLINIVSSL